MLKLVGGLCILSGGLTLRWMVLWERARTLELLDGLVTALTRIETELRFRRPALPELLEEGSLGRPQEVNAFFRRIQALVTAGTLSEAAWSAEVACLPIPPHSQALLDKLGGVLRGDEQGLLQGLNAAAQALGQERDRLQSRQREDRHRFSVCTLSGALLLILLLI